MRQSQACLVLLALGSKDQHWGKGEQISLASEFHLIGGLHFCQYFFFEIIWAKKRHWRGKGLMALGQGEIS
jgi:hypothetical protein